MVPPSQVARLSEFGLTSRIPKLSMVIDGGLDAMALSDTNLYLRPVAECIPAAAQYIRMSTDLQQYSPEAQKQVIGEYAIAHGLQVVRTYEDAGISGLTLRERPALVRLLTDVRDPSRDFDTVLVLDVSRWGRFQDADEAAYYEHECRRAGVRVVYCAEPFQNDETPFAGVYKAIKRAMAGEYSRELSAKVFLGQCRLVRKGFWQGSSPGYGLRRQLIDANGAVRGVLAASEHKAIQSDRVVLIPGPANEVALIRKIFDWFVNERVSAGCMANRLNAIGLYNPFGRPWNDATIRAILKSEKYIGNYLYNRNSVRLHTPRVPRPPSEWVRSVGAFHQIVEPEIFEAAQVRMVRNDDECVKKEIKAELVQLFRCTGYLTKRTIASQLCVSGKSRFVEQFGSMVATYRSVGFTPAKSYTFVDTRRQARAIFDELIEHLSAKLMQEGRLLSFARQRTLIVVDGEFKIKLSARLCSPDQTKQTWQLPWPYSYDVDLMVVVLFRRMPLRIVGFYIFPVGVVPVGSRMNMCEENVPALGSFCFSSLDILSHLTERTAVETDDGRFPYARD
jgi:DNA invertase Pin-like site-specific DNA recombinase